MGTGPADWIGIKEQILISVDGMVSSNSFGGLHPQLKMPVGSAGVGGQDTAQPLSSISETSLVLCPLNLTLPCPQGYWFA